MSLLGVQFSFYITVLPTCVLTICESIIETVNCHSCAHSKQAVTVCTQLCMDDVLLFQLPSQEANCSSSVVLYPNVDEWKNSKSSLLTMMVTQC